MPNDSQSGAAMEPTQADYELLDALRRKLSDGSHTLSYLAALRRIRQHVASETAELRKDRDHFRWLSDLRWKSMSTTEERFACKQRECATQAEQIETARLAASNWMRSSHEWSRREMEAQVKLTELRAAQSIQIDTLRAKFSELRQKLMADAENQANFSLGVGLTEAAAMIAEVLAATTLGGDDKKTVSVEVPAQDGADGEMKTEAIKATVSFPDPALSGAAEEKTP